MGCLIAPPALYHSGSGAFYQRPLHRQPPRARALPLYVVLYFYPTYADVLCIYDVIVFFQVRVSFLQIYNEVVADLLDPDSMKKVDQKGYLQLREDPNGGVYVNNLSEHIVKNGSEIVKLLVDGTYIVF